MKIIYEEIMYETKIVNLQKNMTVQFGNLPEIQ